MSNGKGWTSHENPYSSDEDATRAVPRDQLISAIAPNSSRDHTKVAQAEVFPHQDPTKAINAEEFYKAAEVQEKTVAFEIDSSEEKTRALNTSGLNFKSLKPELSNQSSNQAYSQDQALSNDPHSDNYSPPHAQAYPQSSSRNYPSPEPRGRALSPLSSFQGKPEIPVQTNGLNNFPSPRPSSNLNSETLPQTPNLDQAQALNPSKAVDSENLSNTAFNREDLTQAHLKSQALSELITEHKYQETQFDESQSPFSSAQHSSKRVKRSQLIIYSSIALSILIILVALSSTYFKTEKGMISRINDEHIDLVKLKAPYAIALPASLIGNDKQESSIISSAALNNLLVYFTSQKLWYSDDQSLFENEIALRPQIQKPQIHPLRLNGAFLPGLIHQIESNWPSRDLNQVLLASSSSLTAGTILDLLNTLSINHERKGRSFRRFNLVIEKESNKLLVNKTNEQSQQRKKTLTV